MGEGSHGDLFQGSPREILERLAEDDPLEIVARTQERIARRALLLDLERVAPKALAQVAYRARTFRDGAPLDPFLGVCIRRAIEDAVREDREEERRGSIPVAPYDRRYAHLVESLGLEPAQARRACVRFNDLPLAARRSYFALCVERRSLEEWMRESDAPRREVEEHLRRAFEALSVPFDVDGFSHGNTTGVEG